MPNSDFDFKSKSTTSSSISNDEGAIPASIAVFRFSPRSLALYLSQKWHWILLVFFISVITVWLLERYSIKNSDTAWTAEAKIVHKTRTSKLPSFYQQMTTPTVMEFFGSQSVRNRVSERFQYSSQYKFNPAVMRNIFISREKNRGDVITVQASANDGELAAALANEVAEEGINEYVNHQNSSIRTMIQDNRTQLTNINRELALVQSQKKALYSSNSIVAPSVELLRKNEDILGKVSKKEDLQIKLKSLDTSIEAIKKLMSETEPMEQVSQTIDNTRSIGLAGKKAELEALLKRYTPNNPKVQTLQDEIDVMEANAAAGSNQVADVVTMRKSAVYSSLETQLSTLNIERLTTEAAIAEYETNLANKEISLQDLMDRSNAYDDLVSRETQLQTRFQKVLDNINDLEFQISSSTPDISVMEAAKVPRNSNIRQIKLKVVAISIFLTVTFIFIIAFIRLARLDLMASSEYDIALGISNIGELPIADQQSEETVKSALQKVLQNIRDFSGKHKRLGLLKFKPTVTFETDIQELLNIALTSGMKIFQLKCIPSSKMSTISDLVPLENDQLAQKLLCVVKVAQEGYFTFQNNLCMEETEMNLLRFDIDTLSAEYDVILLEIESDTGLELLSSQISKLTDNVILTAPFSVIKKTNLLKHIEQIKSTPNVGIAGILTDVPKPYYEG